jgi:hypothetical protein
MEGTFRSVWIGGPSTPTSTIITRGIFPPSISNQTTNLVQSTIVLSLSSSVSLIVRSTQPLGVTSSLPLVSNAFSFSMSSMSMQNVLNGSQSISQATNIGTGISSIPYQDFPSGGVYIPPSFPSLGSGSFSSSNPNPFVGWGSPMGGGFQSIGMPYNSTPFTLYVGFRSNPFTSSVMYIGGNPFQGQWNPMPRSCSSQGMSSCGNPFLCQNIPMQGVSARGKPYFSI